MNQTITRDAAALRARVRAALSEMGATRADLEATWAPELARQRFEAFRADQMADVKQAATRAWKAATATRAAAEDRLTAALKGQSGDPVRVQGHVASITAEVALAVPDGITGRDPRVAAVKRALEMARRTGDEDLMRAALAVGTSLTTGTGTPLTAGAGRMDQRGADARELVRALREAQQVLLAPMREAEAERVGIETATRLLADEIRQAEATLSGTSPGRGIFDVASATEWERDILGDGWSPNGGGVTWTPEARAAADAVSAVMRERAAGVERREQEDREHLLARPAETDAERRARLFGA